MGANVGAFLDRGTSPIDWCEDNYSVHSDIAEFWNTVSNVTFLVIPPILMYLFIPYAQNVTKFVHVVWTMLIVIGVCSAYFHATLSLMGQLLDEIAIIWAVLASYATWFPKHYIPSSLITLDGDRTRFQFICLVFSCLATAACMVKPFLNAFLLNLFGIPSALFMIREICNARFREKCPSAYRLGLRSGALWAVAITCWVTDRAFCDYWVFIRFPYLHCIWHVLILFAAYGGLVVFALIEAEREVPELQPVLSFWPVESCEYLIPYVAFKMLYRKGTSPVSVHTHSLPDRRGDSPKKWM